MSCQTTKHVYAVSLVDKKIDYVYIEMGGSQHCTVQLDHQKHKDNLLSKARKKRLTHQASEPRFGNLEKL